MYSQDRKYFRFRYRVIFVAFLLISPTASSAPKQDSAFVLPGLVQCAAIVSALIKDPNGFLKNPDEATIVQGCIQSVPHVSEMMKYAEGPIVGVGMLVVSGYLLYESTKLYERTKGLELNLEKYKDDFQLLEVELVIIKDYIDKDIEPHWRNGITTKMARNLETVIEKLISFVNRLNELADHIQKDIKQGSVEKTWCYGYGVAGGIVCVCSLFTGIPLVFVPTCSLGGITVFCSYQSHKSLDETLEKSKLLKKAIIKKREEITEARRNLEVAKTRV